MAEPAGHAAYVQLVDLAGHALYEGEAIYRPRRADPRNGEPAPQVGIPDDAMHERPDGAGVYRLWFNGELLDLQGLYLERVSTCWWFLLARAPKHPPSV